MNPLQKYQNFALLFHKISDLISLDYFLSQDPDSFWPFYYHLAHFTFLGFELCLACYGIFEEYQDLSA